MYHDFYQLSQAPFPAKPNPSQIFWCPAHAASFAPILTNLNRRSGPIALLGQSGIGKTTLLRYHLDQLDVQQVQLIYLSHASLSTQALLKQLYQASDLDWSASAHNGDEITLSERLLALKRVWRRMADQGRRLILVLDNAHDMPLATLETLDLLLDHVAQTDTSLSVILVGQPDLKQVLHAPSLRSLAQRLTCVARLDPFNPSDSLAYLRHGITQAGGNCDAMFSDGALKEIAREAGGLPHDLNIAGIDVLFFGSAHQRRPISAKAVREALADHATHPAPAYRRLRQWGLAGIAGLLLSATLVAGIPYYQSVGTHLKTVEQPQPVKSLSETEPTAQQRPLAIDTPVAQLPQVNSQVAASLPVKSLGLPQPNEVPAPASVSEPTVQHLQSAEVILAPPSTPVTPSEPAIPAALASLPATPQTASIQMISARHITRLAREMRRFSPTRQQRLHQVQNIVTPKPPVPPPAQDAPPRSVLKPMPRTLPAPTLAVGTPVGASDKTSGGNPPPLQLAPDSRHAAVAPPARSTATSPQVSDQLQTDRQPISPAKKHHLVRFFAEPNSARVIINGQPKGTTPLEVNLELGTYTILVQESGYSDINYTKTFSQPGASNLYHSMLSEDGGYN